MNNNDKIKNAILDIDMVNTCIDTYEFMRISKDIESMYKPIFNLVNLGQIKFKNEFHTVEIMDDNNTELKTRILKLYNRILRYTRVLAEIFVDRHDITMKDSQSLCIVDDNNKTFYFKGVSTQGLKIFLEFTSNKDDKDIIKTSAALISMMATFLSADSLGIHIDDKFPDDIYLQSIPFVLINVKTI